MITVDAVCRNGHLRSCDNLYVIPSTKKKLCRICLQKRIAARHAKDRIKRQNRKLQLFSKWLRPVEKEDLIWAAGIFEGEGTITISPSQTYARAVCSLTSTDFEVIDFFQGRWEGNIFYRSLGGNARDARSWSLNSRMKIKNFLEALYPFIRTIRVKAKFNLALEFISRQRQGIRDHNYKATMEEYRQKMKILNRRGTSNAAAVGIVI